MKYLVLFGILCSLVFLPGCGGDKFPIAPVTGTVKFEDGKIPEAYDIVVKFIPTMAAIGHEVPPVGTGSLDPSTGEFTLKSGKTPGAVTGKNTIEIVYVKDYDNPEPVLLIATPAEVDVTSGSNHFDITVKMP